MKKLLTLTASLLLASTAVAQEVTFRGKDEDVSGTQNQFFVDCTDVDLTSALFDLNDFIGMQTLITGTWNGSRVSPAVLVSDISVVPETFEIGGGGKLGDDMTFGITGPDGAFAAAFFSMDSDFLNLRQGVVLIDLARSSKIAQGTIPPIGNIEWTVTIPNDPTLVGLTGYGQGFYVSGGRLTITNPDCKEVRAN